MGEEVIWLLAPESKYHVLERDDSVPAMFMDAKALIIIWFTISGVRGSGDAECVEEPACEEESDDIEPLKSEDAYCGVVTV